MVAKSTDPETERYITEAAEGAILASAMAAKREKSHAHAHAHAHAHHAHGQHARAGSSGGLLDLDPSLAARAAANKWAAADGVLESISRAVMAPMTDPISSAPPSPRAQLEFMAAIARQGGPAEGKRAFVALLQRRGDLLDVLAEALYKTAEDIASALPAGNTPASASAPPASVPPVAAAAATVSAAARLPRPSATVAGATTVSGASSAGSTATAARRWSRPAPAEPPAAAPSRGSVAARWNGGGAAPAQPTPAATTAAQPGRGSVMARWGGGAGAAATQPPPAQSTAAQPPRGSVMAKAGAFGAIVPAAAAPRTSTSGGRSWAPVRKASLTKSTPASDAPASGKAKGAAGVMARLAMFEGK